jgi:hypothetical protein
MDTETYEVIDYFSAHGPNRGLLVATDCRHHVEPGTGPGVVDQLEPALWRVYQALTEAWTPTLTVAARAHYQRTTVQKALGRLAMLNLAEKRQGLRLAFAQKPGQEWRRVR